MLSEFQTSQIPNRTEFHPVSHEKCENVTEASYIADYLKRLLLLTFGPSLIFVSFFILALSVTPLPPIYPLLQSSSSTSMSNKPTLVLIPGAWHRAEIWEKVTLLLKEQQYKCIPVELPSTTGNPATGLGDDIMAVRNIILSETKQGRDVILVVHSYGGAVGQSAVKGLTRRKPDDLQSTNNQPTGHVLGLVMMACGFGQTGISFIDAIGGTPPPLWRFDDSGFATLELPARESFYHDLPEEEGNHWVSRLTKQSQRVLKEGGEWAYAGWMDLPIWYLTTMDDKTFPVEAQGMFVQLARDAGADVTVREVMSSHSPMLSKPKETVDFILEAAVSLAK
ncbi:hypothetical protein NHQ30_002234 [Ciborinia camelliae]|nr:hypothetical protein NHQ30_002234 [Ciborinia camelliae]